MAHVRLTLLAGCLSGLLLFPAVASGFGGGSTLCKKICSHSVLAALNKSSVVQCWIDCREKIEADVAVVANELCTKRYTSGTERAACRAALHELKHYLVNGELSPAATK